MPLNASAILAYPFHVAEQSITDRDAMLFALSIGLGRDPLDQTELRYVYEDKLEVFPTLPIVLGHPGPWMQDPTLGINLQMLVHGTQRLELFGELRAGAPFVSRNRVLELVDKGVDSGGLIIMERTLHDRETGQLLSRSESGIFCRADGGFGGQRSVTREFRAVPQRTPDVSISMSTQPGQALLYRLNGDRNPLHASPAFAARAGFSRPILHGLCTYSVAAHALMKLRPERRLSMIETRFSKPVMPGETILVEGWEEAGGMAFRARVEARDAIVLDRGFAEFV